MSSSFALLPAWPPTMRAAGPPRRAVDGLARPRAWITSHSPWVPTTTTATVANDSSNNVDDRLQTMSATKYAQWTLHCQQPGTLASVAEYTVDNQDRWPRSMRLSLSANGLGVGSGLFSGHGAHGHCGQLCQDAHEAAIDLAPIAQPDSVSHALAVAVCLMEAYVRFLFAHESSAESRGLEPAAVSRALNTVHPGIDLVNHIAGSPWLGTLRNRADAWYRWITTPSRQGQDDLIGRLFAASPGFHGDGHALADDVAMLADRLACRGVVVGSQGLAPPIPPVVQPLFYINGAEDRRRLADDALGGLVSTDQLAAWVYRGDAATQAVLASREAHEALQRFVDRQVRRQVRGPCAAAPLPRFTDLFALRFYVVPVLGDIVLMGTVESPIVEALLGAAAD
ncbi:hypothetical protein pqer_cds_961 [Pandoravirus quercus]|uniref:Uncharacterized protein n=1 Tax=Pandoravirus quercus TaxID=2107709 RepID=A0A2U7UAB3_9VIRU|nr:hypothetical protein pqer_cds_961 [Pandoravirus quercus]AVK75383.1 hypothetical protein pqer_cds_961 [Pandoravirus quercus]